jgi:hypothetical protein
VVRGTGGFSVAVCAVSGRVAAKSRRVVENAFIVGWRYRC